MLLWTVMVQAREYKYLNSKIIAKLDKKIDSIKWNKTKALILLISKVDKIVKTETNEKKKAIYMELSSYLREKKSQLPPIVVDDEASNKKIYTDNDYGFEFYTTEEYLVTEKDNVFRFQTPKNHDYLLQNIKNCDDESVNTKCYSEFNPNSIVIKVLNDKSESKIDWEIENIDINGLNWEYIKSDSFYTMNYFWITHNDKYYLIEIFYDKEYAINEMKWFKFID